jgi:serine/threonine protein kinase
MLSGYMLRNRYCIQHPLSIGGFGETYIALDEDYPGKRQVVVKHLKPQSKDAKVLETARRLFETEAITLARLGEKTDRIPTLYAHFEEGGEFYLVQEFIEGHTLTQEMAIGQLSETKTLEIVRDILTALKFIHTHDIIHRDLKPDNIIRRSSDGQLVAIDFGAVKAVRQANLTTTNANSLASISIGTSNYMPSEQAMGYPKQASDIYAVGAIGIQCLTGEMPNLLFDEDTLEFRWRHLCNVSDRFAAILDKMLQQRYLDRYANAVEALDALDRAFLFPNTRLQKSELVEASPKQPVNHPISVIALAPASRRNLLRWILLGGIGVVGGIFISQLFATHSAIDPGKKSIDPPPSVNKDKFDF